MASLVRYISSYLARPRRITVNYTSIDEQAYLPNKDDDPELHDLVNVYQKHTHSKTCRKFKKSSNVDLILANSSQIEPL